MKAHRLFAEALAWPFIAPGSLLQPADRIDLATNKLTFQNRLAAFGAADEAPQRLAEVWHDDDDLLVGLIRHATALLQPVGHATFGLRLDRTRPGNEILRWRAISQRLAPGLLAAAASEGRRCDRRVQVLSPSLAPGGPIAHLHVHANAVVDFEALWTRLMTQGPDSKCSNPEGFSAGDLSWRPWLVRMRLVRMLLAAHLEWPDLDRADLLGWLFDSYRRPIVAAALDGLGEGLLLPPSDESDLARTWPGHTEPRGEPPDLTTLWANDPAHHHFVGVWPEGGLLARGFGRFRTGGTESWRLLFLLYLRTRCLLYTHLVLDPARPGLVHFTETFDRADPYLGELPRMAEPPEEDPVLPVDAVEIRVSPGAVRKWLPLVSTCPRPTALVIHFIRHLLAKTPANRIQELLDQARKLATLLEAYPEHLRLVRALDVAGNEGAGPLWQVVPALQHVQGVSRALARWAPVEPLHLTLHVGEDFRHLLSGLRAVDEPLAWALVGRGDRLGHALALGWEAKKWAWNQPCVRMPRRDRLLDLGWSLGRLEAIEQRGQSGARAARRWVSRVRDRLDGLLRDFSLPGQAADVTELFHVLGNAAEVTHLSHYRPTGPPHSLHEHWWSWMHTPEGEGSLDEEVDVETLADIELMEILQAAIAQDLAAMQITIELNPSSNLSIGALDQPVDQPLFRLRPWNKKPKNALPVTLSADDPLQLATGYGDELAYAWAGMVGAGVAPIEANAWLERAVADAWRGRFAR